MEPARQATYHDEATWKRHCRWTDDGHYVLETDDTSGVPVRLFLSERLLTECEPTIYRQIIHATCFPGTRLVVITPDTHFGYGVPVGSVIVTDRPGGAVAMGPVGFDIGCGMMSASSRVPAEAATPDRKLAFNREVMRRVELGPGGKSLRFGDLSRRDLEDVVRGGAEHYAERWGDPVERSRAERHRIPVRDAWSVPWGGRGEPERGVPQLGTLGGGNHFIELQRCEETGTLFVQVHTGSRGFGHGLATNYFDLARAERPEQRDIDLGFFTPESAHYEDYLDAVAAGGNFAIVNRLVIFEEVAAAFRKVFGEALSLVYEISHNLVQAEHLPDMGDVWVHRKGATRAFPGGHPALAGTPWATDGHPVLIPGSNRDFSYILRPLPGAVKSAFSVNHGSGRRISRGEAKKSLDQRKVDEQYRRDGILVNQDGRVPIDESDACYKSADEVVGAVVAAGLARVEHTLFPVASLKAADEGSRSPERRARKDEEKGRDKDRRAARRAKG